jgi:hypothetical protein
MKTDQYCTRYMIPRGKGEVSTGFFRVNGGDDK